MNKISFTECLNRFKNTHGDKYDYSLVEYINSGIKIKIICKDHRIFEQTPKKHYEGQGCPLCGKSSRYSQISINWLNSFNLDINHAKNGGEYKINIGQKNIYVDGYCKQNNTVYEFLGDCWHGNLDIFGSKDKPHPFNDKTAKELNQEWENRKQKIEDLGYNIEYIWENDYKNSLHFIK